MDRIVFRVCSCQKDKASFWERIAREINQKTGLEVELKIFQNLEEEFNLSTTSYPDLYFASFCATCESRKKGFIPVAKIQEIRHKDFGLLFKEKVSKLKQKEFFKLGLLKNSCLLNLLLNIYQELPVPLTQILPIFYPSQEQIKQAFLKDQIDLALLSEDFFKKNQDLINETITFLPLYSYYSHFFLINTNSSYFLWLKDFFLNLFIIENIQVEPISQEEDKLIQTFSLLPDLLSNLWEKALIYETFYKSPHLGVLIYRDNQILMTNEYLLKALKYEPQDIKNYKLEDLLFNEKIKLLISERIKRRCTGEFFSAVYHQIPVKTKEGRKRMFNIYANTVLFQGDFAGIALGIDVTPEVRYKEFIEVIKEVNRLLIETYSEKEMFHKVSEVLYNALDLAGVWVGEVDEETKQVKPMFYYPESLSFITSVEKNFFSLENKTFSFYKSFHEKKINLIPDVNQHPYPQEVLEKLKEFKVRSVCSLPVLKGQRVSHVLVLWSKEPNFFTEEYFELLEELQNNLSFVLKKIDLAFRVQIFNEFIKQSDEILIISNDKGQIEYINSTGYKQLELEDNVFSINLFSFLGITPEEVEQILQKGQIIKKIVSILLSKNRHFFELKLGSVRFSDQKKIVISGKNLTKEIVFEMEKQKILNQDLLTGLLNYQGIAQKITGISNVIKEGILVLLDLYNFSYINHFYGLEAGDKVLITVAQRLKETFPNALISRPVGDSFAFFLVDYDKKQTYNLIKQLHQIFNQPIEVKPGERLLLEFQGSIVFYPEDGNNFLELWRKANILLSEVKKKGPNVIEVFNPYVEKQVENIFFVERLVKKAVQENLFVFYYQPYFSSELEIVGLEALVRIKENGKIFPPGDFIEYLENSPYLKEFEWLSVEKNLANLQRFQKPISINISSKSLETMHIFEILYKKAELLHLIPCCLGIEITEHALAANLEQASKLLKRLKFYKINIFVDDFGTGYSSLHYLKDLPIDFLKIDQVFIKDFLNDKKTYFVLETIISLAKKLNIKTVTEGVETREQFEALKSLGCDYFQGFLFAKPMSEEECLEYIKNYKKPEL
ncbi:EAL domain-containing protein [Thermodesulfobacterium sp. TA1]|uniref:sensor domain-containing phosphodiesterase n=1 Tax=Thermodesulfobacterium sp. TA1 TaxID=2234087 RepID=UPI00143D67A9|nr:EAL domain-containing protein [Thermodesulfobacterium sp. TA1]